MKITEAQLRSAVRKHLVERAKLNEEAVEATDELQRIITKLGIPDVDKSKLSQAMKAGTGRSATQNKLLADFFLGILASGDELVKALPLLKKAAEETAGA